LIEKMFASPLRKPDQTMSQNAHFVQVGIHIKFQAQRMNGGVKSAEIGLSISKAGGPVGKKPAKLKKRNWQAFKRD